MSADPFTLAAIALSATASVAGGISAHQQGTYRAKVAEMNAKLAEENARRSIDRSQVEAQEQDFQTLAALGELEAEQSASGLALGGRSFGAARRAMRTLGRLDALRVRQAGELEAYGYRTDRMNFLAQAQADRGQARSDLTQSFLQAGSSLISGAGKI